MVSKSEFCSTEFGVHEAFHLYEFNSFFDKTQYSPKELLKEIIGSNNLISEIPLGGGMIQRGISNPTESAMKKKWYYQPEEIDKYNKDSAFEVETQEHVFEARHILSKIPKYKNILSGYDKGLNYATKSLNELTKLYPEAEIDEIKKEAAFFENPHFIPSK